MMDEFTLTLDSPITEEQWDMLTDVDFDHANKVMFHTKHGKEVTFVKIVRCKDCKHSEHWYRDKARCFLWYEGGIDVWEDGYCSYGERRTDE